VEAGPLAGSYAHWLTHALAILGEIAARCGYSNLASNLSPVPVFLLSFGNSTGVETQG
jgi:hypothetical protein